MRLPSRTIAAVSLGVLVVLCYDVFAKVSKPGDSRQQRVSKFNFGTPKTLKLEIALAKKHVMVYEPILLTIKFNNVSNHVINVFMPIHIIGKCEVVAPDGTKLPLNYRYSDMMVGSADEHLQPGKSISSEFNLMDYFNLGKQEGVYIINYHYDLIEVVMFGEGSQAKPGTRKVGVLTAKTEVRVEMPKSNIDKRALALFKPAITKQLSRGVNKRAVQSYEQIIKKYPTSKYAELASYYLAQLYDDTSEFELAIKYYEDFMRKYPKSYYTKPAKKAIKEVRERAIREKALIEESKKSESQKSKKQKSEK